MRTTLDIYALLHRYLETDSTIVTFQEQFQDQN